MRLTGSFPAHVARAYGVQPTRTVRETGGTTPTGLPGAATGAGETVGRPDPRALERSEAKIGAIVGAKVESRVDILVGIARDPIGAATKTAGATAAAAARDAFPLYTRPADRVEAAVGVELGAIIDIKG